MAEFLSPVDIANRALQHCGSNPIDPTLGFSENSQRAAECAFAYGKLRRAELQRNLWTFATRRTPIRKVDSNTMLLKPALYVASTTYFAGSIVQDQSGTLWSSRIRNNLGNDPQNSPSAWEPYFGPLGVSLYDSSQAYFCEEIVYTSAGDGTYNVYRSLINGNAIHPALPNQWSETTVYFKNQVVQVFPAWAIGTTYSQGQTVTGPDGNVYSSLINANLANSPPTSGGWALKPVLTLQSQMVPLSGANLVQPPQSSPIQEWQPTQSYSIGNFVLFNGLEYLSIGASNTGNEPPAATFWVAVAGGSLYMSLIDLNTRNNPSTTTIAAWSSATTYSIGQQVTGSDGVIYTSVTNGNTNNDPTTDGGTNWTNTGILSPWTTVFTQGGGNSLWVQIGGSSFSTGVGLDAMSIMWPVSGGPHSDNLNRNFYRLPAGYLRRAPQMPSAGKTSFLGFPSNLPAADWEYNGDYLVTWESRPILFRFVADVQDVTSFTDLFCEGLACRIALEIIERLTQSTNKFEMIAKTYTKFMTEARTVGGIEAGTVSPPLDDFITTRM